MKLVVWPTKPLSKIICSPEMMSEQFSSLKNSKAVESICQLHIDPKQRRQEKCKGRCSQDDGEKRTSQCTLAFLLSHARESTPQTSSLIASGWSLPGTLERSHHISPILAKPSTFEKKWWIFPNFLRLDMLVTPRFFCIPQPTQKGDPKWQMLAEAERKLPGSAVSICSKSFEKFWSKRLEGFLPSVENFKQQKSQKKKCWIRFFWDSNP